MLNAIYTPAWNREVIGHARRLGEFWIAQDKAEGSVCLKLTVPAESTRYTNVNATNGVYFAAFHTHYDGVEIMKQLFEIGFMTHFEQIQAKTFYDVFQCFMIFNIPVLVHDSDKTLIPSRKLYDRLYTE